MTVQIRVNGTRAVVSEGIWQSPDAALQQMLTAVCASELLNAGYVPDLDLTCARIVQEQLGAEIITQNSEDEQTNYPPDALFSGIDDRELEIPKYSPVCTFCKHLKEGWRRRCAAFDQAFGIPLEIWRGENNHRQPFPGDGGITFEARETGR